jgi:microcystin-dependent protein
MSYTRTYTIDASPTGDTVKAAVVDKIDPDLTSAVGFINTHEALTATHGATGAIVGTTNVQTLTNKTINGATLSGTITGTAATLTAATLSGVITGTAATLTNATLSGTVTLGCTLAGTATGGTLANTTLSGVTTAAGIINSGILTGGTLNGLTLTGTITATAASLVGFTAATETSGVVKMFAGETAPTGYLECDGSAVSRTTYSDLFTAIGELHGQGNNTTTFNLPDLRGYFVRGWDHGATNDPDVADRTAAATGGGTADHVGSVQTPTMSSHLHAISLASGNQSADHAHNISVNTGGQSATHTHNVGWVGPDAGGANAGANYSYISNGASTVTQQATSTGSADHTHSVSATSGGVSANHTHTTSGNSAATGNAANDTRPKNKSLMYIIKT